MMPLWSCTERLRWAARCRWLNVPGAWEWFDLDPLGTESPMMKVKPQNYFDVCYILFCVSNSCSYWFILLFQLIIFLSSVHGSVISLASNASSSYSSVSVGGMQTQVATVQYVVCIYMCQCMWMFLRTAMLSSRFTLSTGHTRNKTPLLSSCLSRFSLTS